MMNLNKNLLNVCLYADTTGLFSESECDRNNLVDLLFPEWLVAKWYFMNERSLRSETSYELHKPIEECTFADWYEEVSHADDCEWFYNFAMKEKVLPTFGIEGNTYVFYRDEDNFKTVVFTGNYDECRRYGKEMGWEIDGNELEVCENLWKKFN